MSTSQSNALLVRTEAGSVLGSQDGGVRQWLGVPYAQSTAGANRFRAPRPLQQWEGVRPAIQFGDIAPQPPTQLFPKLDGISLSEDCLSLNIWAPSGSDPDSRLPVMVWIHGGGYIVGASAQPVYDGHSLAAAGNVIVVTVNYRLGALGFLNLSHLDGAGGRFESNLGLKDIVHALRWVRANIAAFGGNPDDVTLFGQSAGAAAVTTLMTLPAAHSLFHKAIAQSPPATSVYSLERAATVADAYLRLLDIETTDATQALVQMDSRDLVRPTMQLLDEVAQETPGTLAFAPIVDGEFMVDYPMDVFERGEQHAIPLLIGSTHDEAALFKMMRSPLMPTEKTAVEGMFAALRAERPELDIDPQRIYQAYPDFPGQRGAIQISSDAGIGMPVIWIAEAHARRAPTFAYRFDQATIALRAAGLGAVHASELPYVFGTVPGHPTLNRRQLVWLGARRSAQRVSDRMQAQWLHFAQQGRPTWPAYSIKSRSTFVFDRADSLQRDPFAERREAWGSQPISFL